MRFYQEIQSLIVFYFGFMCPSIVVASKQNMQRNETSHTAKVSDLCERSDNVLSEQGFMHTSTIYDHKNSTISFLPKGERMVKEHIPF